MKYATLFKTFFSKITPKSISTTNIHRMSYPGFRRAALRDPLVHIPEDTIRVMHQSHVSAWLTTILKMNKLVGSPARIEGNIRDITTQQWLSLEHQLCVQLIKQCGDGSITVAPTAAAHDKFKGQQLFSREDFKYFTDSIDVDPFELMVGIPVSSFILVTVISLLINFASGSIPALIVGFGSLLALFAGLLNYVRVRDGLYWTQFGYRKYAEHISETWDDVFAMKNPEDALLLTWLQDTILQAAETGHVLPRFTTMSPKEAVYFLAKMDPDPTPVARPSQAATITIPMLAGVDMSIFVNASEPAGHHEAVPVAQVPLHEHQTPQ